MALQGAHRGYEYQDLLSAARAVDLLLDTLSSVEVDRKKVADDRFDDLSTVDKLQAHQRVQFKHTDSDNQPLSLQTFSRDTRGLRLDRLVGCGVAYRDGPGANAKLIEFRIILRDTPPVDPGLTQLLQPAVPDPGPFLPGLGTLRFRFDVTALWAAANGSSGPQEHDAPMSFLSSGDTAVRYEI